MMKKIGRNNIKMQEENNINYQPISSFIPLIKIQLDVYQHPPILWTNPKQINNQQQQKYQHYQQKNNSPLQFIHEIVGSILEEIISKEQFLAFRQKFKKIVNKNSMILVALMQIRYLNQQKQQQFYIKFRQTVRKIIESQSHHLQKQQTDCLKDSIVFIQQFLQGEPSKAVISFFTKYKNNKRINLQKIQDFLHNLQQKFTSNLEQSQFSQQYDSENMRGQLSSAKIKQSQERFIPKGNPFLIYKKQDQPKSNLYPVDLSFTPKGIKNLLPLPINH